MTWQNLPADMNLTAPRLRQRSDRTRQRPMAQLQSTPEGQSGPASPAPPRWIRRATQSVPERRARMLEHMARARSAPQAQAATATGPSRMRGKNILGDAFGYMVLFGIIALLVQSRV